MIPELFRLLATLVRWQWSDWLRFGSRLFSDLRTRLFSNLEETFVSGANIQSNFTATDRKI